VREGPILIAVERWVTALDKRVENKASGLATLLAVLWAGKMPVFPGKLWAGKMPALPGKLWVGKMPALPGKLWAGKMPVFPGKPPFLLWPAMSDPAESGHKIV
jgi:hypothetical protein